MLISLILEVQDLMSESVSLDHACDMASVDFDSHLVRDFDGDFVVSDSCDPAIDPAAGQDLVSLFQVRQKSPLVLGPFLLGSDEQEIEDNEDENDGRETHP